MHMGQMGRVGQNRVYTPYMTVYLVISLPKVLCIRRMYMVLASPTHGAHAAEAMPTIKTPHEREDGAGTTNSSSIKTRGRQYEAR